MRDSTIAAKTALASAIVQDSNYNAIITDSANISSGTGFRNSARLVRSADAICKRFNTLSSDDC